MPSRVILVATPNPAFGELLRLSLEESGRYTVRLVQSGSEALASASRLRYDLVILDASISDHPFASLEHVLLEQQPDLHMIVIPDQTSQNPDSGSGHTILENPFYLPDLLETVDRLLSPTEAGETQPEMAVLEKDPGEQPQPSWLENTAALKARLSQSVSRLPLPAAFIVRGTEILAWAGTLGQADVQEISAGAASRWNKASTSDLAFYIRVHASGEEYLLYTVPLSPDLMLVTAHTRTTPISLARGRLRRLVGELTSPQTAAAAFTDEGTQPADMAVEDTDGGVDESALHISLTDLLSGMPSPNPEETAGQTRASAPAEPEKPVIPPLPDWLPDMKAMEDEFQDSPTLPGKDSTGSLQEPGWIFDESTAALRSDAPTSALPSDSPTVATRVEAPRIGMGEFDYSDAPTVAIPSASDTQPISAGQTTVAPFSSPMPYYEPGIPMIPALGYTVVLLPRLPQHLLVGEIARLLGEWMPQLHIAFGWRLEGMVVSPEYLEWTVVVTPAVTPGTMVRIIRQRTSGRIFTLMPSLQNDNPSGEFWAPGYLVVSGLQPPNPQVLRNFMHQTRMRQGLVRT